jgi:hypothetical protein
MSRLAEFTSFMQNKMVAYTELLTKYNGLKEKECAVMTQTEGKKEKREMFLRMKENNTLSKEDNEELNFINKEHDIDMNYERNLEVIRRKKDNAIREAEASYERGLEYYKSEKEASLRSLNRTHTAKKNMLELQKKRIEGERSISIKTATELAIDTQKRDILTQMKSIIDIMEVSRKQAPLSDQEKLPSIPVLPEVIVSQYVPQPMSSAVKEIYDMEAENSVLREEFRMKRRERDRADREREREESVRKPTVYGFIHELEGRPYVKPCYNPPVPDYEEEETSPFTKE